MRLDGRELRFEGYTVAAANTGYYGGGMHMAPGADPSDGLLEVVFVEQVSKRRFLANLPKVFKGEHVEEDTVSVHRAREVEIAADRPVRRVRGRRADHDAARDGAAGARRAERDRSPLAGILTLLRAKVGVARAAGALSRASRRGGGTSLPGKLLLRMEPQAPSACSRAASTAARWS